MNIYDRYPANIEATRATQNKQKLHNPYHQQNQPQQQEKPSTQRNTHLSMLNSLQQMYYGIRNSQSSRETYSQAMLPPQQAHRDASNGQPRPLQQTYSRYIDQSQ